MGLSQVSLVGNFEVPRNASSAFGAHGVREFMVKTSGMDSRCSIEHPWVATADNQAMLASK